ncbi:hypothetical protein [Streptomyces sp. NPDC002346]
MAESLGPVRRAEDETSDTVAPDQRDLLNRYVRAFEDADISGLLALLADDAVAEMPPFPTWFAGRHALALAKGRVSRIYGFLDPDLLALFGLAPTYDMQVAAAVTA